ncbi:centromere protein V-like isoform X2 [Rhopilema esculentum]|uniref:centromere protein V-like isoform X2 n=1 Tax=Rhopilema esculentum TaxID=499914 RepID=UPI0031DBA7AF
MAKLERHYGGCHCGEVRFLVKAPAHLEVIQCNCSICRKKQNLHFIVPESNFELLKGEDNLTCYTFNTNKAKHLFCKTCGVQSFYRPRSNPNGVGVMPHCLDEGTVIGMDIQTFDDNVQIRTTLPLISYL